MGARSDNGLDEQLVSIAYIFSRRDGDWHQQTKLTAPDTGHQGFGAAVGIADDGRSALLQGYRGGSGRHHPATGYLFATEDGQWDHYATFLPETEENDGYANVPIRISGDGSTAILGANFGSEHPGEAYLFNLR